MQQVLLADQLYDEATRRARSAGFASVDEYVADLLNNDLHEGDHDSLFTYDRIAQLDLISAEIKGGGKTYSPDEVREHFRKRSESWQEESTN